MQPIWLPLAVSPCSTYSMSLSQDRPLQVFEWLIDRAQQRRWQITLITGCVAVLWALYLGFVFLSGIDHDEVEHLHVGYRILEGLLPYRDFHQNHMPVYWLASVQFAERFPFSVNAILAGRAFSTLALLGCWLLGFRWLKQFRGGQTWFAYLVYTWVVILVAHAVEFYIARPDPLMTLFATAGLCLVPARGGVGSMKALTLGALFGAAAAVSTKILPIALVVPGLILVQCLREQSLRPGFRLVPYGFGFILGILPVALWVSHHGLIQAFHADVWLINLATSKHWTDSFGLLQVPVFLAAALGALLALSCYRHPGNRTQNAPILLLLTFAAGLLLALISRHSAEYNFQILTIPLAIGFTLLALTAWLQLRQPALRLVLLAALLGYPTTHTAAKLARLHPGQMRISQTDLQEMMDLARPGDRSCIAFSPAHPVFCNDVSALSNQWDLFFTKRIENPEQARRFQQFWREGIESTLARPPDILLRRDSIGIWESAAKAGLITRDELEGIDRLEPLYNVKMIGENEIWVKRSDRAPGSR